MPVRDVLAIHSSLELAEWMAYEKAFGPIDDEWRDNTLAEVHELLQGILHITASANSKDGTSAETKPKHFIRPSEVWPEIKRLQARGDL